MTTESLLVKTKDNHVIVLNISYQNDAEKMRLTKQCERYCQNLDYNDFDTGGLNSPNISLDKDNTEFLRDEIFGYDYRRQPENFVNGMMDNNYPPEMQKPNVLHFDMRFPDDFFPDMIKNIGYAIKPEDEIFNVSYNSATKKYEAKNFKTRAAAVDYGKKQVILVRNHFQFSAEDYAKLQSLIADFNAAKRHNPHLTEKDYVGSISNDKDASLFSFYANQKKNVDHSDAFIIHELKHIKNAVFTSAMGLKDDYKKISVDNMYRLSAEDERSAYLNQLLFCVNKYLKQGDYNDYSMFDGESASFARKLRAAHSNEEKKALAIDLPTIVKDMMEQFKRDHKDYYDRTQFAGNLKSYVESEPVSAEPDVNNEMFKKIRSLYYNYKLYNPDTGKDEYVNLSKYITPDMEVEINDYARQNIIEPAERIFRQRENDYRIALEKGTINPALVAPAKALMRKAMNSSEFVNEVDGMSVGRLIGDNNPINTNPPQNQPQPQAPVVPDDKAYWSDDLKKYWSKVDGYEEVAKNNNEYTFKINDAKVSYSDKNHVRVTSNADFELYVKLLKEPSNKNNTIEFAPSLSKEQALMLYIACTNYGHKMSGKVPTDLSGIDKLQGIPPAEMNKFNHRNGNNQNQQAGQQRISQAMLQRRINQR